MSGGLSYKISEDLGVEEVSESRHTNFVVDRDYTVPIFLDKNLG